MSLNLKICSILFIVFGLLASSFASAQEIDKTEVDGFTGDTTWTTEIWNAGNNTTEYLGVGFSDSRNNHRIKDHRIKIEIDLRFEDHNSFTIKQGNKVYMKMDDKCYY